MVRLRRSKHRLDTPYRGRLVIVVKVGGSLFDHPRLGLGLASYLDSLAPADVLLVPGGGAVVDAVRELDRVHGLGEEASHWLALRAMGVTGELLEAIFPPPTRRQSAADLPLKGGGEKEGRARKFLTSPLEGEVGESRVATRRMGGEVRVLDCLAFAQEDESRHGALPHSWDVTSDSIAARAAVVNEAGRLVLLKSVDVPPGTPWEEAAARGWVDPHFPKVAAELACPVEVVNFRRVLESF
jgi:aspartokinase-like uncharacterized kinase